MAAAEKIIQWDFNNCALLAGININIARLPFFRANSFT